MLAVYDDERRSWGEVLLELFLEIEPADGLVLRRREVALFLVDFISLFYTLS